MKLIAATAVSLFLFALASAQVQDQQTIKITRSGTLISEQGSPENFTGPSSIERPSQKAIGDFAPKLAELTDDVLYGDVWERPQLSPASKKSKVCAKGFYETQVANISHNIFALLSCS
jgi:hypothetical protein